MNWDNIRFNTPEAFKKLLEFNKQFKYEHGSWYDMNNIGMDYYIERDLFSFFDERGLTSYEVNLTSSILSS